MVIGCLRLSDVSVTYRVVVNPRRTSQKNVGRFLVRSVQARPDFELIPTVEMETRNPMEGYFGSEFPAICNHCGVMAAVARR